MDPNAVALVSVCLTAFTAVTGFWAGPRATAAQEERRWRREQRAATYVDMLSEANAEQTYRRAKRNAEVLSRPPGADPPPAPIDARLPPDKHALLRSRVSVYGSAKVSTAYNAFEKALSFHFADVVYDVTPEGDHVGFIDVDPGDLARARAALEKAVRRDLGTE